MIHFVVPAIPIAQPRQRHRIMTIGGKNIVSNYTPTKSPVNAFKAACQMALSAVYDGPPMIGAIIMPLVFVMPRPSNAIWKTKPMPRYPHITKPDRDNLAKSLKDSLEGLLYKNDSQICGGNIEKWVAAGDEQPHVEATVWEFEEYQEFMAMIKRSRNKGTQ